MNRKKLIVSNNLTNKKFDFRNFLTQYLPQFFEMHNLDIMWLYALRFDTRKFSVDAFSLLYYKLLLAKLCLFVFGATFAEWHWQFISICSCCL